MTSRINRRQFVSQAAVGAASLALAPSLLANAAAIGLRDNRILVIIQLEGGNDGLNTVIPHGDDLYYRARPKLGIPAGRVIKLDKHLGLHPELVELKRLYDEGALAIVQNIGYPNPDRSHFSSTEVWQTAALLNPAKPIRTGWVGRYFEQACTKENSPALGLQIGDLTAQAFATEQPRGVTIANPAILEWPEQGTAARTLARVNRVTPTGQGNFDFVQRMAHDTLTLSQRIQQAMREIKSRVEYPPFQFSQSLKLVGQMIAAELPTRVFYVSLTGFDTHVAQANRHAALMQELSQGVSAFVRDLKAAGHWDRTMLMTFSEFGRRVKENAGIGTDHGAASMMFVTGGAVVPGLYGGSPDLQNLDDGDLKQQIDFRSVYAAALQDWFSVNPEPILLGKFDPLPLLKTTAKQQARK